MAFLSAVAVVLKREWAFMQNPWASILFFFVLLCSISASAQRDPAALDVAALPLLHDSSGPSSSKTTGLETVMVPAGTRLLVAGITVIGNKKTRTEIILREIPFAPGQAYPLQELADLFERAQQQLMNTTLFHSVRVGAGRFDGNCVEVQVEVLERWYLFPFPYFKLVDRNLNQWLVDQQASLSRVNYGVKLLYNNVTGHADKLRLWLYTGYTQQLSMSYEKPYIDRALRWGFRVSMSTGKAREVNYNTLNDKQVFYKTEDRYARRFTQTSAELSYRKKLYTRHVFGLAYNTETILDTVARLNPDYFGNGLTRFRFPEIYYRLSYLNVDYIPYPLQGSAYRLRFGKSGWSAATRQWQLHAEALRSWQVGLHYYMALQAYAGIRLPFSQPFVNRRMLGYGDIFLKGYEYYVVDGVAGGYLRASLTRKLMELRIPVPEPIRRKKGLTQVPVRFFARVFANSGYVYHPSPGLNQLNNRLLHSGGVGIDLLSIYDITFRLEYSFNQLGQNGLFLHRNSSF